MYRVSIPYNEKVYVRPCDIAQEYSISRTTVWRMMQKMSKHPKYCRSIIALSPVLKLINRKDWESFVHWCDCRYLRD